MSDHITHTVTGFSMVPVLMPGDIVQVKNNVSFEENSIIVFQSEKNNMLCIHRLLWKNSTHIITAGDAHFLCDRPTPFKKIKGEVCKIEPGSFLPPYQKKKKNPFQSFTTFISIFFFRCCFFLKPSKTNLR